MSHSDSAIQVDLIIDEGIETSLNLSRVQQAVQSAAAYRGYYSGSIGVRVTDDATIRQLNAKHLDHDWATDVISFGYTAQPPVIDGELVISIDTATTQAAKLGWSPVDEMLLYIIHGTLHITNMDDHDPADRAAMRAAEQSVMLELGIQQILACGADQHESSVAHSEDRDE